MAYNRYNYLRRTKDIQALAHSKYEEGRQDRNWRWVWRNHINPRYHICYHSFLRYMRLDPAEELKKEFLKLEGVTLFPLDSF